MCEKQIESCQQVCSTDNLIKEFYNTKGNLSQLTTKTIHRNVFATGIK
jgi:hypothetical protein